MASAIGKAYRRVTRSNNFKKGLFGRGMRVTTKGLKNLGRLMTLIFVGRL